MIKVFDYKYFVLESKSTSYILGVNQTGQMLHIYYGAKITVDSVAQIEELVEKHEFACGTSSTYNQENGSFALNNVPLEMSSIGKGDDREPLLEIVDGNGALTSDFVYESFSVNRGVIEHIGELPGSYGAAGEGDNHLCIIMTDKNNPYLSLKLNYVVYENENVIARNVQLVNSSDNVSVRVNRLLSMLMDLPQTGYKMTTFSGCWTNEMNEQSSIVSGGKHTIESRLGSSSNQNNPFFMVSHPNACEEFGPVYGFNLIYSGNHYAAVEASAHQKTRVVSGINPIGFEYELNPGETLDTPEAVMTFSSNGFRGVSENFHPFVRAHIVRGEYQYKERPVLLNSWEANYFNISESKLVKLAKAAHNVGIELLVMDDGWFGHRDDDKTSLGDWHVNKKKLPGGLSRLADKVNSCGVDLGIWIEPEMISEDSDLYKVHPEWALRHPTNNHSQGRNQMLLDLCNPEVVDYMIDTIAAVLDSANISYVKWDYNRNFTDFYSPYLETIGHNQNETGYRYILGFYRLLRTLTEKFPHILFEGCASGGNRFDLGMLCYFPQIWASDDTDAISRLDIQHGYSYGYPQSCYTSHVSDCPNHQTLRNVSLDTRFAVACNGVLGYELNLCECSSSELQEIKKQVEYYKAHRRTFQFGQMYRKMHGNIEMWNVVGNAESAYEAGAKSEAVAKTEAVATIVQRQVKASEENLRLYVEGLDPFVKYHVTKPRTKYHLMEFGSLVNAVAPIHIKSGGFLHKILALFIKMDSEEVDCELYGDALANAGLSLHQAFVGTGYNDKTRYMNDGSSRMYTIEESELV